MSEDVKKMLAESFRYLKAEPMQGEKTAKTQGTTKPTTQAKPTIGKTTRRDFEKIANVMRVKISKGKSAVTALNETWKELKMDDAQAYEACLRVIRKNAPLKRTIMGTSKTDTVAQSGDIQYSAKGIINQIK